MTDTAVHVKDAASLQTALDQKATRIVVEVRITGLSSIKLPPGTQLWGEGPNAELQFKPGQPGLMLSADHEVSGLRVVTDEAQIALGLADDVADLGTLRISKLRTVGCVHLKGAQSRQGHIHLQDIHVEAADARMAAHRPAGFGVEVLLGCISVYNFSQDKTSRWTVDLENLSGGSKEQPLRGSGVFVFGGWFIPTGTDPSKAPAPTEEGGSIELTSLTTGEIHADGGIAPGISNLITGAVFIGSGVDAQRVVNTEPVTTYGPNDMVLDNWGKVEDWMVQAKVTSYGPSGIGFVNFGDLETLTVQAPLETHGVGARGFNLYDGSLQQAEFQSITTFGDGGIGVQLSKPFGSIVVHQDIRTKGGEGESLVRGEITKLKANALSLKEGTRGHELLVKGQVVSEQDDIPDYDFQVSTSVVDKFEIGGKPIN